MEAGIISRLEESCNVERITVRLPIRVAMIISAANALTMTPP